MNTWLHFIGRQYYTEASFAKEGRTYGVTRRVSSLQLGCLAFGDRVLLAMADGKSSVVFGYFVVEKLSGLSPEAMGAIAEEFPCRLVDRGGRAIRRGCGSYISGPSIAINAPLKEVADKLKGVQDPGKLMVGGTFFEHERVRLKDIAFFRGFRRFDYERFRKALAEWTPNGKFKMPTVAGQFYLRGFPNVGFAHNPISPA